MAVKLSRQVADDTCQLTGCCYGCMKCTAGCPVSFAADLKAHEVIRLVNLGQLEKLLKSNAIWLCVFCKTCQKRCPNDIDTSLVKSWLREKAAALGIETPKLPKYEQMLAKNNRTL